MVFGELYRYQAEWKLRAVGQGHPSGCPALPWTSASPSDDLTRGKHNSWESPWPRAVTSR
jgi:hypothetical protein